MTFDPNSPALAQTAPVPSPAAHPETQVAAPASAAGLVAPAEPSPAQAPAMTYDALAQALVRAGAVPVAQKAPAPAPRGPIATTNRFTKGALVVHRAFDPYTASTVVRHGIVVDTFPYAGGEDVGARSAVAWFKETSGPITDSELEGA